MGNRVNQGREEDQGSRRQGSEWQRGEQYRGRKQGAENDNWNDRSYDRNSRVSKDWGQGMERMSESSNDNYRGSADQMNWGRGERMESSYSVSESGKTGQFAGVGPKNFSRSKERVMEDVNQRLTDHPELDASNIEVDFEESVIILRGTVNSRGDKRLAEDIAEEAIGVADVRNELRVGSTQRSEKIEGSKSGAESSRSRSGHNAQ